MKTIVKLLNRNDFMEIYFGQWQWVRKAIGGHWEYWWVSVCWGFVWIKHNTKEQGRIPCTFGTPIIEEW